MELIVQNVLGIVTLALGIILLLTEFSRKGLSICSLFAYLCFVASSIFMSQNLLVMLLTIAGLTVLFALLYFLYRRSGISRHKGDNQ